MKTTTRTKPMEMDLRWALRHFANEADPSGESKGTNADLMRQAAAKLDELAAMVEAKDGALREIIKGEGRFSTDHLTHASNTIEDMQALARAAIAIGQES